VFPASVEVVHISIPSKQKIRSKYLKGFHSLLQGKEKFCVCVYASLQIPCHINSLQSAYQDTKSCVPEINRSEILPSIECIPEVVK
jgi:hypothetical protein